MRILLLNQAFYPDVVATGQYLADVALALTRAGHEVTVLTSRRGYDSPRVRFARRERWQGVDIIRVASTWFGKQSKWGRLLDFGTFLASTAARLVFIRRQDAVLALTSPPLISVLGAVFTKLRGGKFYYWVMDFNPDEAIVAGWLREGTLAARLLDGLSRFSLKAAERIIVLDRFMKARVVGKGIDPARIVTLPPWAHDDAVRYDAWGRGEFRRKHGLSEKFVVMYSGNHSPCHPLDTLLQAAQQLESECDIVFCFVGGGSEHRRIQQLRRDGAHPNILCLPYQPLEQLKASLSAADLQVVVMGGAYVGIIHPCKIYNVLGVGAPVLSIAPAPSHLADIDDLLSQDGPARHTRVNHGEADRVAAFIRALKSSPGPTGEGSQRSGLPQQFSTAAVLPKLLAVLGASVEKPQEPVAAAQKA